MRPSDLRVRLARGGAGLAAVGLAKRIRMQIAALLGSWFVFRHPNAAGVGMGVAAVPPFVFLNGGFNSDGGALRLRGAALRGPNPLARICTSWGGVAQSGNGAGRGNANSASSLGASCAWQWLFLWLHAHQYAGEPIEVLELRTPWLRYRYPCSCSHSTSTYNSCLGQCPRLAQVISSSS